MASQSVQFFGRDKVLQAYNSRGIETWGLFDKKQFINAGENADDLSAFLEMLEPGGSQSVYTLKVYRDVEDIDLLTDRTECNGSFNFKLFKAMEGASLPATVGGARYASIDPIVAKLQGIVNEEVSAAIDKRLNGGGKKDEEESSWNEVIMGYVNDPVKLNSVLPVVVQTINAIRGMFSPGASMGMPVALAGTVGQVRRVGAVAPAAAENELPPAVQAQLDRLSAVITRLEAADPDILNVLEKIADLAENNKAKYNMAKSLL